MDLSDIQDTDQLSNSISYNIELNDGSPVLQIEINQVETVIRSPDLDPCVKLNNSSHGSNSNKKR